MGGSEEVKNILSSVNITLDDRLYRSIEVNSNLSSPFSCFETLANLTDGVHNLTIQTECEGWDVEVHGLWAKKFMYENSSDLITFTVDEPEPYTPSETASSIHEPFPIAYSMGILAAIVFVLLGATVYILKRKR